MGELLRNARHEAKASRNDGNNETLCNLPTSRNDSIVAIPLSLVVIARA